MFVLLCSASREFCVSVSDVTFFLASVISFSSIEENVFFFVRSAIRNISTLSFHFCACSVCVLIGRIFLSLFFLFALFPSFASYLPREKAIQGDSLRARRSILLNGALQEVEPFHYVFSRNSSTKGLLVTVIKRYKSKREKLGWN